ncbi:DNA polymerase IV 3 [uncultured Alphaproteobacteria bacterium]|uniref:DNA polymerase IV n=1 Tax=uncultured Alphaproteobacteria bacterium TaxID=91750 RepID=A0A212J9N4_9PROT|nr:DNA polymerase IV 3 [uncultured Alphaproteobacteria bacterium]
MTPDPLPAESAPRKIIHVDMDAFYASVEQRDDPALRGRPVTVGRDRMRGVVAAASYEARAFGVRSAMPSVTARHKCPELVFVPPRFEVYRAVSAQIRAIFARYTPLIEPLSLDEAYLDVTANLPGLPSATAIATEIRAAILAETGLTASAGISYNKFLAKIASDANKPNGQFVIAPKTGAAFVAALPVRKFHGIGPATAEKMRALGIETGADLAARSLAFLTEHFGKAGRFYYWIARGVDDRPVRPNRERKSLGTETTFLADLFTREAAQAELDRLVAEVCEECAARNLRGRTATLKVKYADFRQITRSHTAPHPIVSPDAAVRVAAGLLAPLFPVDRGIRLLGFTLSSFEDEPADAAQLLLEL